MMSRVRGISIFVIALALLIGFAVIKGWHWLPEHGAVMGSDSVATIEDDSTAPSILEKARESRSRLNKPDEHVPQLELPKLQSRSESSIDESEWVEDDFDDNGNESELEFRDISELEFDQQERISDLDWELAGQNNDSTWSTAAVEEITNAFDTNVSYGNSILGIECGETLCRLEVMHEEESNRDQFTDKLSLALEWQANSYINTVDNHDGTYNTVLYISRQDYHLP